MLGNIKLKKTDEAPNYTEFDFSNFNKDFFTIEREALLRRKSLKQRLSNGFIDYDSIKSDEEFIIQTVKCLTRFSYSIFSFITNEKYPVFNFEFNSIISSSGTFENLIQIGLKILTQSNIPYNSRVDVCMGIIVHELLHKRITNVDIKRNIGLGEKQEYYKNPLILPWLDSQFPTKLHAVINNILEDRRIERLGTNDFPGYTFLLEEFRRYGFFLHSKKSINPELPEAILLDYLLIKILLPELENTFLLEIERFKTDGIKKLLDEKDEDGVAAVPIEVIDELNGKMKKIDKAVLDIKFYIEENSTTVFSDDFNELIAQTNNIFNLFPKNLVKTLNELLTKEVRYSKISEDFAISNKNEGSRTETSDEISKKLQEIISDEIKKIEEEESRKEEKNKAETSASEGKVEKIKFKNNFTNHTLFELIEAPIHPIDYTMLAEAKKISKSIFNNIGFLDSKFSQVNELYELTEGDIDESEIYSLGFGNKNIFEEIEDIPGYTLDLGILLDESGSMKLKIREAKLAVLALILSLKDNKRINLFVYGHTAEEGLSDAIRIYKYYNNIEHFTDWRRIFSATHRTNNADGFAIEKVGEIMANSSKVREKILIVVSDGQPAAENYEGPLAEEHVRQVVQKLKNQGVTVIQLCMNYIENSPRMFQYFIPYQKEGQFFINLKKILIDKLISFSNAI